MCIFYCFGEVSAIRKPKLMLLITGSQIFLVDLLPETTEKLHTSLLFTPLSPIKTFLLKYQNEITKSAAQLSAYNKLS